jgi:hypothetical protein
MRKKARVWLLATCALTLVEASDAKAAGGSTFALQGSEAGSTDAFFGYSAAIDGNTAVVGALNDGGKGAAYVFLRSGTTWALQQQLTAADGASGDQFGYSVAVSGNTAVVGAVAKGSSQGYVYVFGRTGVAWTQEQEFTAADGVANDCFGCSVAVRGTTAVVGTPQKSGGTGAAYVFTASGSVWQQQQEFKGQASGDSFGFSVALSPDATTALIGAYGASSELGKAYALTMAGTWANPPQQAILTAADGQAHDRFGYSVSADSGTLLIGAYQNAGQGAAYLFTGSGTAWSQQTKLVAADGAANDLFGYSVALSGNTAVAGAYEKSGPAGPGAAYVFTNAAGTWTQQEVSASGTGQYFGYSVAASGTTAVVGGFGASSDSGEAYFFASNLLAAPALGNRWNLVALTLLLAALGSFAGWRNRMIEAQ